MALIYLGNERYAAYVLAPTSGMDADTVGFEDSMTFLNGGAYVSNGAGSHREYNMSWATAPKQSLDFLAAYRNGVYGTGLLSFVDPFLENWLPPHWANPSLATRGWPSILGPDSPATAVTTGVNSYNQPYESAVYTVSGTALPQRQHTMLIPDDQQLVIGFSGSAVNGAVVRAQPILRSGALAPVQDFTLLSPSANVRMNKTFSGAVYKAVRLYVTTTGAGAGTLTLTSGKAVYAAQTASVAMSGSHIEGEGHTGLRFSSSPSYAYIKAASGKKYATAAAKLVEVGAWL